jgi:hypothetical protein
MMIILLLLLALALAFAAARWGANSTDSIDGPEWNRREVRGEFL